MRVDGVAVGADVPPRLFYLVLALPDLRDYVRDIGLVQHFLAEILLALLPHYILLKVEPLLNLLKLQFLIAVGKLTDSREGLQALEVRNKIIELLIQLFPILHNLLAALRKLLTIKVLCELPGHLLPLALSRRPSPSLLTDQHNILQLVYVGVKLLKLRDLVIQGLLELLLNLINLLLHLVLVVLDVDDFAEDLVLLLLVNVLQLLNTVAHGREPTLNLKEVPRGQILDLAPRLNLLLQLIKFLLCHVF